MDLQKTRKKLQREVLNLKGKHWVLELATGTGKTKLAIEKLKSLKARKVLIVVPTNVLKDEWSKELSKWSDDKMYVSMVTYKSFPKEEGYCKEPWDCIVFDEGHHLSERCVEGLEMYDYKHVIVLSATLSERKKQTLYNLLPDVTFFKRDLRDVIGMGILPDPKVFLVEMKLKSGEPTECIVKNPDAKVTMTGNYKDRFRLYKTMKKDIKVRIRCNQKEYYDDLTSQVEYWKNTFFNTGKEQFKNKWLKLCKERLDWMAKLKTPMVKQLLSKLEDKRTLTFCCNIAQSEELGSHSISSKNKESSKILDSFNNGEISHITACNMLNEGCNLVNCQIGVYASISSSETAIKQKMGRLLRHPEPILIIPYFTHTREEDIVKDMTKDYNPELITVISNINDIVI